MIELRKVTAGYGARTLISDASATFARGTLTALIGRNGSGKSTLLRSLAGLQPIASGSILLDGEPRRSPRERALHLAYVGTGRIRVPDMRCRDVVALGRTPYTDWIGNLTANDHRVVDEALATVGMTGYAARRLDTLSDGECQRIMIARALAQDTPNILLDEPTSFLDIPSRHDICALLARLATGQGKCIVFSTHELDLARTYADAVGLIDGGTLICPAADSDIARAFNLTTH